MVEIYCGDGKGKTTAAIGLSIRAVGHKIPVYFFQFMKNGASGEIGILKNISGVQVTYPGQFYGFVRNMTDEQKEKMKTEYAHMMTKIEELVKQNKNKKCMIVLDEIIHACIYKLVDEDRLCELIDSSSKKIEIVLTGRNPSLDLINRADYISEMRKQKHPYDKGVSAREGIEY